MPSALDPRPSVESILQLCADVWDETIDNVWLTVQPFRTPFGNLLWRAIAQPIIGVLPHDNTPCFVAESGTELTAMAQLYEIVATAFRQSPHGQAIERDDARGLPGDGEGQRAWIAWDRRTEQHQTIFEVTEDRAIAEACEHFGYEVIDLVRWNSSPRDLVRLKRAPMLDRYQEEQATREDAESEAIAVLARIEAVCHRPI